MQKLFLVLAVLFVTVTGFSQQEKYELSANQHYRTNDTFRTYTIISGDIDQIKTIVTEKYGKPKGSGGVLTWKKIAIPGIKRKVNIMLYDGIATYGEDYVEVVYKNIDVDKTNLKENQARHVEIRVLTTKGKIFVNNAELETIVKDYLMNILNKKE